MSNEMVAVYLDLISARAKALAYEARNGKLWEGELQKGLSEIESAIKNASHAARTDR